MADNEKFQKVTSRGEKKEHFDNLARLGAELSAKSKYGLCKTKVNKHENGKLYCEVVDGSAVIQGDTVTVSFEIATDKYFMNTSYMFSASGELVLNTDGDLYKFERRKNFRVKVPKNCRIEITKKGDKDCKYKFEIFNISVGGVGISIQRDNHDFQRFEEIEATMYLGSREPLSFRGCIRQIQRIPMGKKSFFVLGVQFINMTPNFENRIFTVVMELYREYFARWQK